MVVIGHLGPPRASTEHVPSLEHCQTDSDWVHFAEFAPRLEEQKPSCLCVEIVVTLILLVFQRDIRSASPRRSTDKPHDPGPVSVSFMRRTRVMGFVRWIEEREALRISRWKIRMRVANFNAQTCKAFVPPTGERNPDQCIGHTSGGRKGRYVHSARRGGDPAPVCLATHLAASR